MQDEHFQFQDLASALQDYNRLDHRKISRVRRAKYVASALQSIHGDYTEESARHGTVFFSPWQLSYRSTICSFVFMRNKFGNYSWNAPRPSKGNGITKSENYRSHEIATCGHEIDKTTWFCLSCGHDLVTCGHDVDSLCCGIELFLNLFYPMSLLGFRRNVMLI